MHRRCASWHAVPLHTPLGVLHKTAFSDLARRSKAKTAEALFPSSFHSAVKHYSVLLHNMKHSAYAPYDEKMKNERAVFANIPYQRYLEMLAGSFSAPTRAFLLCRKPDISHFRQKQKRRQDNSYRQTPFLTDNSTIIGFSMGKRTEFPHYSTVDDAYHRHDNDRHPPK